MSTTNDGSPAFPIVAVDAATGQPINGCFYMGMSLRDYFAARAMQQFVHQRDHNVWASDRWVECRAEIAKAAYYIADAMLAAREGGSK